ncbi:MAG: DUF5069 domain-containing protein [Verrucomicrobia bacterium]|nr:DUF5069 domain-containing protein [Verrucomicrobiota bacterium]
MVSNIRSPLEKLAGCNHLARFTDKIRLHLAGKLPEDYQMPLFHERGVDGFFMRHFGLTKEELLEAVQHSNYDDDKMVAWFETRIGNDEQKKKSWNELSVSLGKPGQPMHDTLAWARKKYNFQCDDPNIDSVFKTIEWDEGRVAT